MTNDSKFRDLVQAAEFANNMLKNQLALFVPQPNGTYNRTYSTMGRSSLYVFTTAGLKLNDIACHSVSPKLEKCKTLEDINKKIGSGISGVEITVTLTAEQYKTVEDHYRSVVAQARQRSGL